MRKTSVSATLKDRFGPTENTQVAALGKIGFCPAPEGDFGIPKIQEIV
jgi:hypothetical protein